MERKSGFKECPRCGLRNKPSAAQCDFCGWEFQDATDEWISHVKVLENMSRDTESLVLDDEVSKRIQSTIVRTSRDVPIQRIEAKKVVSVSGATRDADLSARGRESSQPRIQTPRQGPTDDRAVKDFMDIMIGEPAVERPIVQAPAPPPAPAPAAVAEPTSTEEFQSPPSVAEAASMLRRKSMMSYGLLSVGCAIYVVTLLVYSLSLISVVMGWSLAIIGALMITVGTSYLYDDRAAKRAPVRPVNARTTGKVEQEVLICPRCNEEVATADNRCPGCGVGFMK